MTRIFFHCSFSPFCTHNRLAFITSVAMSFIRFSTRDQVPIIYHCHTFHWILAPDGLVLGGVMSSRHGYDPARVPLPRTPPPPRTPVLPPSPSFFLPTHHTTVEKVKKLGFSAEHDRKDCKKTRCGDDRWFCKL